MRPGPSLRRTRRRALPASGTAPAGTDPGESRRRAAPGSGAQAPTPGAARSLLDNPAPGNAQSLLASGELLDGPPRQVLPQYAALHDQNPHFFGWLRIDDTPIDYPVMFSPEDPEHYLHRDFYGEYSYSGTPFVEGTCDPDGSYYIVYAHHMKDGTMFGALPKYAEQEYWQAHPVIRFDTLYEQREYRVIAAFRSRVYGAGEQGVFRYYEYTDLSDPERFEAYLKGVLDSTLYNIDGEIVYGDELLALSTCNNHAADGRFVVVAKRIVETEKTDTEE